MSNSAAFPESIKTRAITLLRRSVLPAAILLICYPANAQSEHQVYFAGHGFDTQCNQVETKFQYLSAFLGFKCGEFEPSEKARRLSELILGRLPAPSDQLSIVTEGLGSLGSGDDATVLALVFDGEMVHHENLGGTYKLLVVVSAQVVAFDFNGMDVVWSKPIVVRYVNALTSSPRASDINRAIDQILFGNHELLLPSQFARSLKGYRPSQSMGLRLGVEKVSVAPGVWKHGYPAGIEDRLASELTWTLASNLGVSVVPPTKTDAVDNKMAARMSDGAVYTLDLPKSDYPINITLDNLRKVEYDRTKYEVVYVFQTSITFDFGVRQGGDSQVKSLFTEQIKQGTSQLLPVSAQLAESSDGLAYYETMELLFDNFTVALENPSHKWTKDHVVSTKNARKAVAKLNELKEVIDRCR